MIENAAYIQKRKEKKKNSPKHMIPHVSNVKSIY